MKKRLMHILNNIRHGEFNILPTWMVEPVADALIENGVILSTFKVGDVVWVYDFMWGVIPCEVDRPYHCRCGKEGGCTFEMSFEEKDIGRDVFATEKECREYNGLVLRSKYER